MKLSTVVFSIAVALSGGARAAAQGPAGGADAPGEEPPSPNVIFTEVGGPGVFGSVGYERLVAPWLSLRGGVGGFVVSFSFFGRESTSAYVTFPLTVSALIGLGAPEVAAEVGVSAVPVVPANLLGAGSIGIRYRQAGDGMVLRVGYTPLFVIASEGGQGFAGHWGGVLLGKSFR